MEVLYGCESKRAAVLTFGNFDGVHLGHARIFSELTRLARDLSLPSAVLTFSPHTAVFFRQCENFLLTDFEQKVELIAACGVDYLYVVEFGEEFAQLSPDAFINDVLVGSCRAEHVVVGESCVFGHKCVGNLELLKLRAVTCGYEVTGVPQYVVDGRACSSSRVRECLQLGDLETANLLLGRRHVVSGKVLRGKGRGRSIGFPTLNLSMDHTVLPKNGVYGARVNFGTDGWLPGIANIGVRPTFSEVELPLLEMHIFDFDKDMYGAQANVELVNFIRPERRFSDVNQLIQQIEQDISRAKQGH
ncbi:riboflavin biosynthesis protein RibF [Anaplasma capra]|uniref:riboflavin biosynthesis protein RibF n=1 Tax=Anaplasma capra TaxID=1562740 RepID=UPI0021D601F5|nr:riboflavin biosynthesis protein RibF [Anaplasma capra]MCU7611285.1 riboflavin biosynthesis protein RibF [Anaplasma capra]MCU7612714.1 riboflavin biosynthesis protein RibF [Anaplasma capra]